MSDTYTKLFSSITASTIWLEPHGTRLVWITMLAMADRNGCVYASVPGLADRAKVSRQEIEIALACFLAPDPDSRTKDYEGRRIEEIDGGWRLLNHTKFRELRTAEERRAYMKQYMRDRRALAKPLTKLVMLAPPTPSPDKERAFTTSEDVVGENVNSRCPVTAIVDLYHTMLPMLPKVEKITPTRKGYIQQRWREDLQSLEHWSNFFSYVEKSRFLTGKVARKDQPPFLPNLEWLTKPANYAKIAEGNYHRV